LGACGNTGKGGAKLIHERQYIKDALYDWIAAVIAGTGRTDPVIHDNGKGPRPVPPFISLKFVGVSTPGSPNYSRVKTDGKNDGVQFITRPVKRSLTLYAFAEDALDLLETVRASIDREAYIAMLAKKGLAIPQALDVTENPSVMDNEIENSAFFDFWVTYIRVIEDAPGWIESVSINSGTPMGDITINATEEANG
jgi:hypothetical protein